MMGVTENIQACLRIFWQLQHQWLARDILHRAQGVFYVFVLLPVSASRFVLIVLERIQRIGFILVYRLAIDARPERVMMGVTENIQACLRIFRRAQHQWLARDILHLPQGVFYCFCLTSRWRFKKFKRFKGFKPFLLFLSYTRTFWCGRKQNINLIKRAVRRCTLCPCQHQGSNAHSGHALGQNSKGYLCEFL